MTSPPFPPGQIDALVADLSPVRRLRPREGLAVALIATAAAIVTVALVSGLRTDVLAMRPQAMVLLRSGALLLLGLAALGAVVASARPAVGQRHDGWRWALAAAALFPLTSALLVMRGDPMPGELGQAPMIVSCFAISLTAATAILAVLTLWLRRGAITDVRRAGWLGGLAAGALGTFAYSLHCPSSSVHYIAVWYTLAVLGGALLGRIAVPRMIRW